MPEGNGPHQQQKSGREDRNERERGPDDAARRRAGDRTEIGRKGEQGPRHGLGGAVTRKESAVGDPARIDNGGAKQRQHHMPAPEHKRPGPVEGGGQRRRA